MSPFIAAVVMLSVPGQISVASLPRPVQIPATVPAVDPDIFAKAKEWFHRFQTGDIDRTQLDTQVNAQLTNTIIRQEAAAFTRLGEPASFSFVRTYPIGSVTGYDFILEFDSVRIVEMIAFDAHGKIAGIAFEPFVRTGSH